MAHPAIGRFFAPLHALISLGIAGAGGLLGYGCWERYLDAHRISLSYAGAALVALVLSPVYFALLALPQGCRACQQAFTKRSTSFPSAWKEVVLRFLTAPDQATWQQLARAPQHGQSERLTLTIAHCAKCGQIGKAELCFEEMRDSHWQFRDFCHERVVEGPIVTWLLQIAELRGAS